MIEYIKGELNKSIRYVGTGALVGDKVCAYVEPLIINNDSLFAGVKANNNMISLVGDNVGQLSFFGQGAGKYPTGVAVAQDVIDIVNGEHALKMPKSKTQTDNDIVKKQYYVRTKAEIASDLIASVSRVDADNYIITKEISVAQAHELASEVLKKDGESFFAGIER